MKNFITYPLFTAAIFILALTAIAGAASAQDCKTAIYFMENKTITIMKYDKSGMVVGKDVGTVSKVEQNENGIKSQYNLIKYDKNNKIKEEGNATVSCEKGDLKIGFQVPNMENNKTEEAFFSYPSNMTSGQKLEAKMEMHIKGKADGKKIDVYFKVENRQVMSKGNVMTPAGTYNAFKIGYDMDVKIKVVGIGIPMKLKVFEWYSPGTGVIKTESYNKDGQLVEMSVLSSVK